MKKYPQVNKLKPQTKIYLVIFGLAVAFIFIKDFVIFNGMDYSINQQNILYYYSSSAQAIATFIAFLIAGYAIVYQTMTNLEQKYEEKKVIFKGLKKKYHDQLRFLTFFTGLAIILSLIVVWSEGYVFPYTNYLITITDFFVVLTIMSAIWFVLGIIDPEKEDKIAQEVREEKYGLIEEPGDVGVFIENFMKLEFTARELLRRLEIPVGRFEERLSMGRMLDDLIQYEVISHEIYEALIEVNVYRDLVVHGNLKEVDQKLIDKTKELDDLLQGKLDSIN